MEFCADPLKEIVTRAQIRISTPQKSDMYFWFVPLTCIDLTTFTNHVTADFGENQ